MSGSNALPITPVTGLNTLLLSALTVPGPDIIALAATVTPGLIVDLPGPAGLSAFAIATTNVGADGIIQVRASAGSLSRSWSRCARRIPAAPASTGDRPRA